MRGDDHARRSAARRTDPGVRCCRLLVRIGVRGMVRCGCGRSRNVEPASSEAACRKSGTSPDVRPGGILSATQLPEGRVSQRPLLQPMRSTTELLVTNYELDDAGYRKSVSV